MNLRSFHYFIIIAFTFTGYSLSGWAKDNSDWICSPTYYNLCGGYYQQPTYPYPCITREMEAKLPFEFSADRAEIHAEGLSYLTGQVDVTQGNKRLQTEEISFLRENNILKKIEAPCPLIFTQPDVKIEADSGFWDPTSQIFKLNCIDYRYYPRHARGHAKKVTVCPTQLKLYNGTYTTCAPGSQAWELSAKTLTLDKTTGRGEGQHMLFKVAGLPVFYWPYLNFPIDSKRHSGFLAPRVSSTSNSGFEIDLPFYWNIAPQYDYLITPRILSERGVDFQNRLRYLMPYATGQIDFNFLPHDKKYPCEKLNRIKLDIQHDQRFHKNWKGDVDFHYVGDNNYFIDLEQDLDNASIIKLLQEFKLSYASLHWDHMFRFERYQILYPKDGPIYEADYHRQPEWSFHGFYPQQGYAFTFELDGALSNFTHSANPFTGHTLTIGQRYQLRPGLSLPLESPGRFLNPRIQIDWLRDDLTLSEHDEVQDKPNHLSRAIPIFDINTGLILEKQYNRCYRQTLEPSLYYLYVPYVNQDNYPNFDSGNLDFSYYQLFRDNRFSGRDRLGDTNQLTTALTSRLYNAKNEELVRTQLGQIFYFTDRKVRLPGPCQYHNVERDYSDLVFNLDIYPNKNWSFSSGIEWDPDSKATDKAFVSFQYLPDLGKVVNLDYYWMRCDPMRAFLDPEDRNPLQQINASFTWPIHRKLNLLGQIHYDLEEQRVITMLSGIEYLSCCFAYQIVGSRYLKPNNGRTETVYENGIFFQIYFKGLTTLSFASADQQLSTAIAGYTPFAKKLRKYDTM